MKRLLAAFASVWLLVGSVNQANAGLITFDVDASNNPLTAPGVFASTVHLTELYAPLGVHFSGPSALNGGAILNQSGGFSVNAHSGTNFLAFNSSSSMQDGGIPTGPETITFDSLMSTVSIFASGGSNTNTLQLQAFDASNAIVNTTTSTAPGGTYSSFSVSGAGIKKVVLTQTSGDGVFVVDDLSFTAAVTTPEPSGLALLGVSGLFIMGYLAKRRRAAFQSA